jgi:hypothetical protein
MKVLLVSYDLKKTSKNYTGLYNALKEATAWWHYLRSCWLLKTDYTPQQWYYKLKPHIDDDDSILIIEVVHNYQGWLSKEAWDWISKNI